jgi:hypothetical protein
MKKNSEHRWEQQVDQALRNLPDLPAPASLVPKVMRAIHRRAALPWYRQPWPVWPAPLQGLSLAMLLGGFGAFVYAAWQLTQAAGYQAAWEEVRQAFTGLAYVGKVVRLLAEALLLVAQQLGTPFIIGCLTAASLAYGLLIGFGTLYCRVALALRRNS